MEELSKGWPETVKRSFQAIIFDWDGTAVMSRTEKSPELIRVMEKTLRAGTLLVIVTGTKIESLTGQVLDYLSAEAKKNLYVCTNRGSEVYGYSEAGIAKHLFRRDATAEENRKLDEITAAIEHYLAAQGGLLTKIISNRMNRRKVDLIPLPSWESPKKSELGLLLTAVTTRLAEAGFKGGISDVVAKGRELADKMGLPKARITSDIKHVEIGLTDKSDSVRWIYEHVLSARRITPGRVVVMGDEFGPVGKLEGSDSFMCIPELKEAAFLSVGPEPGGVPKGISHIPGGPSAFVTYLNYQMNRSVDERLGWREARPTDDPSWLLEQAGFNPSREREMETLFTVGNGYLGVRGALLAPIPISEADLIVSGIYGEKVARLPYSETDLITPDRKKDPYTEIVTLPFPFRFVLTPLPRSPDNDFRIAEHERKLDLKQGIVFESYRLEDQNGNRLSIRAVRWASLSEPHLCFQEIELMPLNFGGCLHIDARIVTDETELHHPHLARLPSQSVTENEWSFETIGSRFHISMGARLWVDGEIARSLQWEQAFSRGESFRFRKVTSVFTSRDDESPPARVRDSLAENGWTEYEKKIEEQRKKWGELWERGDISFGGETNVTHASRFATYSLLTSAPRFGENSIPAKGLSGRGYEGHIFWDTEVFILPYLLYCFPECAKQTLLYRHVTLPGAKARARGMGCAGACYAWESTVDGRDMTPETIVLKSKKTEIPIFTGTQQIHVTADVAAAVFRYWEATLDEDFLATYGTEILIETARFWCSRFTEEKGNFHILKVVGPDEYHHSVDDNAYTNWMARFNLSTAVWAASRMRDKWKDKWDALSSRIHVTEDELEMFRDRAARIYFPEPNSKGVIEQFRGFFDLKQVPLRKEDRLKAPLSRLFGWREINQVQLVKQADVLMLPFVFPEKFSDDFVKCNYAFYEPITDHGSSLSPSVHAAIAARIELWEDARFYWNESLTLDLKNRMGNTPDGIHLATMGGVWQALVFGYLGVRFGSEPALVQHVAESLPKNWLPLELRLYYRGKEYPLSLGASGATESKRRQA